MAGAGKTVFLSSMFHQLNYRTPRRSYYLDIDPPEDRIALNAIYQKVSDPSDSWPRGTSTGETKEYQFRCVGWDEHGNKRPVLQLSYLDFAGGLLDVHGEPGGTSFTELIGAIKKASALLILLDGRRIRQLLQDEQEGRTYFATTLRPMIGFAQNASCPIHFVLTKWDLIQDMPTLRTLDEPARLRTVANALFQYEYLESLVYDVSRQQVVRLIPVSSVGPDYVHVDSEGRSAKRPDGTINPTNVDAPLSAIVPDLFRQVEASLGAETKRSVQQELRGRLRLGTGKFLAGLASLLARPEGALVRAALQASSLGTPYGDWAYTLFLDWLTGPAVSTTGQPVHTVRGQMEQEIDVIRAIRGRVMKDFDRAVDRLEYQYPTSLLSSR